MRIGIVNEQPLVAETIRRLIVHNGSDEVAWIAHDGAMAVIRCHRDRPDLILMGLSLPQLDGVVATRQIMTHTPCAIVIAMAKFEQHTGKVFEAMGAGALDAVSLPLVTDAEQWTDAKPLLAKIETIRKLLGGERKNIPPPAPGKRHLLVTIGASAGGPDALAVILSTLPDHFPGAVVIVQHLDKRFAPGLTTWFGNHTKLTVQVAKDGEHPEPGVVLLAGRDRHLILSSSTQLSYSTQPDDVSYCPSVDVFFQSVARQWQGAAIGVLLTGMGHDGANGLKALRRAGHHTIAQDRSTSAIYGMPKAAAELDAATDILTLDKIGPRLTNIARLT